jgi:hypothetical protein
MAFDPNSPYDLNAFLAMPTPRRIPPTLQLRKDPAIKTLWIVPIIFIAFGGLLSWVFFPFHLPKQWKLDRGPALETTGQVLNEKPTNLSINKTKVYQYRYRFSEKNGVPHEAEAFTTGSRWNEGAKIDVRYLQNDPSVSVPVGARMGQGDKMGALVLIFPVLGCLLLTHAVRAHLGRKGLLLNGRVSAAKIAALQKTWTKVNNQQQYKITVIREDDGGTAVRRTHDPMEIAYAQVKLDEGQPAQILYNPRKPKHWVFPEVWKA